MYIKFIEFVDVHDKLFLEDIFSGCRICKNLVSKQLLAKVSKLFRHLTPIFPFGNVVIAP